MDWKRKVCVVGTVLLCTGAILALAAAGDPAARKASDQAGPASAAERLAPVGGPSGGVPNYVITRNASLPDGPPRPPEPSLEEQQKLAADAEPLSPEKLEALAIEQKLMEEYSGPADESMSPEAVGSVLTAEGVVELPNVAAPPDSGPPRDTAPGVKISQVYSAGGNAQSPLFNDYVEIYNSSSAPVSLSGWSVQYATSTGSFSAGQTAALPAVSLLAGQYLLVQFGTGGSLLAGQTPALPTPQATNVTNMADATFKVALVNSVTPLASGTPTYAVHTTLKDFVGVGTSANWNDASAAGVTHTIANNAPPAAVPHAVYRRECGARDTDNSRNDWDVGFPAPRNTATALNLGITVIGTALPLTLEELQTARLTATPYRCATNDLGVGTTVSVNTALIGGGPTAMLDDGIAPDEVASDGIYTVLVTVAAATTVGTKSLPVTVSDGGGLSGGSYIGIEVKPTSTPDNDNCYLAQVVTLPFTSSGTTYTGATVESNSMNGYSASMGSKRGLWYQVVGTGNTLTASLCTGTALDSVMMVMCGSCDGLTVVGSNDTSPLTPCSSGNASVAWCSALGTPYYVWVSPYSSLASVVAFTLTITEGASCTTAFPCTMCVGTPGPFTETEPGYGIHTNDGCLSTPNLFTNIASPTATPSVIRGTARGMMGNRDADSYRFQAASSGLLTMTIDTLGTNAQAQLQSLAAGGLCPQVNVVNTPIYVARCVSTIQTATGAVTAGNWYAIQVVGGIGIDVAGLTTVFGGQMPGGTTYQYTITTFITPAGACCKVDGTCAVLTAAGCAAIPGAIYQGDDIPCTPTPCPPAGACCMYVGTCVNSQTEAYCTSLGGTWQGAASVCGTSYVRTTGSAFEDISATGTELVSFLSPSADDGGCTLPIGFTFNFYGLPYTNVWVISNGRLDVGATAYTSGYGAVIPTAAAPNNLIAALWKDLNCTGKSVRWQLFGTTPSQYLIVQFTGVVSYLGTDVNTFQVVLFEGSDCIELRYLAVAATGYRAGIENLGGTVGTEVTALVATGASIRLCPITLTCPVNGACCHIDDSCTEGLQSACSAPGDIYLGAGTHCTVGLCIAPIGACCFADGHCTQLKEFFCTQQGGTSWLAGVLCDPNPCLQPDVRCCYTDGSCLMQTAAACTTAGGTPGAYPSTCTPDTCPKPGACCKADQTCYMSTVVAPGDCLAGDSYRGNNTTCATPCPAPGVNCGNPIQVPLSLATLPYVQLGKTNCGFIDDYDYVPTTHCLYYYDSGEDILYQLNVTEAMDVTITLDPKTTTYAGVAIGYSCPPMDNCIAAAYGYAATPKVIGASPNCLHLEPGVYYIMVDTWSTPDCIPIFDLKIEQCVVPTGSCCVGEVCSVLTAGACAAAGGTYGGDTTDCDPDPCALGACCLWPSGGCEYNSGADCQDLGGTWHGGLTCLTYSCPIPGDLCTEPMVIPSLPFVRQFNNDTATAGTPSCNISYTLTQNDWWFQYTPAVNECAFVDVYEVTSYDTVMGIYTGPDCNNLTNIVCVDDPDGYHIQRALTAGTTYWFQVGDYGSGEGGGVTNFSLYLCPMGACCVGTACTVEYPSVCATLGGVYVGDDTTCAGDPCLTGACCVYVPSLSCTNTDEAGCVALGGNYHVGMDCTTYTCPPLGDNCGAPIVVTLPAALPYTDPNQYTCGRVDDYNLTCLGLYDGGEDIIYQLIVTAPTCVTIIATGATGNTYIGIGLDTVCPPAATCMAAVNSSSGTVATMANVGLPAGTYYVMVDTWPAPACLTDFTLTIETSTGCASGACCAPTGCYVTFQSACTAAGGTYGGTGSACSLLDCNGNMIDDFCDLLGGMPDCNDNGIPDVCELVGHPELDIDQNGVPDECQPDCNENGLPDTCDVPGGCLVGNCNYDPTGHPCGLSLDCQPNGIPDECEVGDKARVNLVVDPSFEAGTPSTAWTEFSTNFGTPLCDAACGTGAGTAAARTGAWWCWFGGVGSTGVFPEVGSVTQAMVIPSGGATLEFYLWMGLANDPTSFVRVLIDGNEVVKKMANDPAYSAGYTVVTVDVSAYANGGSHTLKIEGQQTVYGAGATNMNVDDVALNTGGGGGGGDCNDNGIPDFCDIRDCHETWGNPAWCDCDGNGQIDSCEIATDPTKDCNNNGRLDKCDVPPICVGTQTPPCSVDCNANLKPDECEIAGHDCNNNGIIDSCDLAACTGQPWCSDCNGNGILDFCDIASLTSNDCQGDGIPDECQLSTEGRAIVWDNGPMATGAGCTGQISVLQDTLGLGTYAFGAQQTASNSVADDFTLTLACQIDTITVYTYQTGSTPPTITSVVMRIWNGPPNAGGTIVWGDLTTNRLASCTGASIFRTLPVTDCTRHVQAVVATVGTTLPAGTYWVEYSLAGTGASGPWAPPVTILGATGKPGANALQNLAAVWGAALDGTYPQDFPFLVEATCGAPANDCNNNFTPDDCDIATAFGGFCEPCVPYDPNDPLYDPNDPYLPCDPNDPYLPCDTDWNGDGIPDHCQTCGDFTGDGFVNADDYWYLYSGLGYCAPNVKYTTAELADMDGDLCITLVDYQNWVMCYRMENGKAFVVPKKPKPVKPPPGVPSLQGQNPSAGSVNTGGAMP